jgi:hypothetical protein
MSNTRFDEKVKHERHRSPYPWYFTKEYATGQHMRFEVRDRLEKFTKSLYIDTIIKVIGYIL